MKLSGKNHISILTRFFFVLTITLLGFFNNAKNVYALYGTNVFACEGIPRTCVDNCITGYHPTCLYQGSDPKECSGPLLPTTCYEDNNTLPDNYYICSNMVCDTSKCSSGYEGKCTMMGPGCTGPLTATKCTKIPGSSPSSSPGPSSSPVPRVDPTKGCTKGINTGLGCIPYTIEEFTPALLGFLVGIIGAIALVVMLIGTITIMTASGNPEAVKKGKELFTAAITGLLFIIFSVALLRIVAGDIIKLPGF